MESHLDHAITLDDVARVAGVSRHHLLRGFDAAFGWSVVSYLRARRLSEAAGVLASGARSVLTTALESGYGSHEAFSRAFRSRFGATPQEVRARGSLDGLDLVEPLLAPPEPEAELDTPGLVLSHGRLIAGIRERHSHGGAGVPAQWRRFAAAGSGLRRMGDGPVYGVRCHEHAEGFDYLCGTELRGIEAEPTALPPSFSSIHLQPGEYLVFEHADHISGLRRTLAAIWNVHLPESGRCPADAPFFARCDTRFDARTGLGGLEVWIPLAD